MWQNDKLHIYVENGGAAVPKLVHLAEEKGLAIKHLSLARPTLDDVFLKYTGTTLEDSKEEEGEEWWQQWAGKGGGGKWQKNWEKWQDQIEESGSEEEKAGWQAQMQQWQNKSDDNKSQASDASKVEDKQQWPQQQGQWSENSQGDWQKWQNTSDDKKD